MITTNIYYVGEYVVSMEDGRTRFSALVEGPFVDYSQAYYRKTRLEEEEPAADYRILEEIIYLKT